MAVPATKLSELIEKLEGRPSEFELHAMSKELTRLKKTARDARSLAEVHSVLAGVFLRLGKFEDALGSIRTADRLWSNAATKTTLGGVLLGVHRPAEAIDPLAEAADLDDRRLDTLLNLCPCLSQLGSVEDARAVFERGLEVARLDQPVDLFALASMASSCGYDAEAVELFARALAARSGRPLGDRDPVEFIRETPDDAGFDLTHMPVLSRAIDRAATLGPDVQRLAMLPSRTLDVRLPGVKTTRSRETWSPGPSPTGIEPRQGRSIPRAMSGPRDYARMARDAKAHAASRGLATPDVIAHAGPGAVFTVKDIAIAFPEARTPGASERAEHALRRVIVLQDTALAQAAEPKTLLVVPCSASRGGAQRWSFGIL